MSEADARRRLVGSLLVLGGAGGFAAGVICAILAYRTGVTPVTLIMMRSAGFALLLGLIMSALGQPTRLPPTDRARSILLGLIFSAQSFGFFHGISLIPVSIGALVEYTFPIQTALVMWLFWREPLGAARLACFAAAFAGLWLVLDVQGGRSLDRTGLGLVVLGSVLLTVMTIYGNKVLATADSRRVTLHTTATVAAVYALLFAVTDLSPSWPQVWHGWPLLAASSLLYLCGLLGLFTGLAMIGPTRAAMLANLEPVLTLALAAAILGEVLAPGQLVGATLVIGAIFASQFAGSRRSATA